MKYNVVPALVAALVTVGAGQTPPPAPDIFLAALGEKSTPITAISNISNNPGYDNQPYFLPDSKALLFTSDRDGKQTDIYRYDLASGELSQVTHTPEREYSPTPTPDGKGFSVIRVEADGAQRLWRFDMDGTNPRLVLERVQPVGYHAWIDDHRLALFVLGDPSTPDAPATLRIADTKTGKAEIVDTGIGRSLLIRPGRKTVSYVSKAQPESWMVKEFNPKTRAIAAIVETLTGSEDLTWLPDGRMLMGQGSTLFVWRAGGAGWTEFAKVPPTLLTHITRLAASPDGKWLAIVGEPVAK